ncbi:hypothetical protein EGW08_020413 [Elysia chlorotica]|uniref:DAGKc domain-containing protein n=1 Tax=Elysia chlorotica TaxID=188477 RepID=A0A433SRF2_ELYCH|nr:hypothetical protein EGW08_020413 [Elysia chlorotica]
MASRSDEVIMERDFLLLPKRKGRYKVTLSQRGIYFSQVSNNNSHYEESLLKISDIVGCHCLNKSDIQSTQLSTSDDCDKINDVEFSFVEPPNFMRQIRNSLNPFSCGFVIFAYPFVKKKLSSKQIRQRQCFAFEIPATSNSSEEFQERRSEADIWQNVINRLCREVPVNLQDLSKNIPPERKPWLFLINPFSGPGKAHTIFKQDIVPILYEASIPYKALVTTHAGHASELVKTTNLSEWYGIVIVSGDGLIFETINGIMQRDDWASSLKTPIGCLPGGSGNALCCSINYAAGEPVDVNMVLHSAFVLVKHRVIPMDLVAVHLPHRTCFSFLSITWGIMADIDYETEKYRNLGETRFTVGAVVGILGQFEFICLFFIILYTQTDEFEVEEETYLGRKADFSPVPTPLLPPLAEPLPDSWVSVDGDFVLVMAAYQTHLGSDMLAAPDARLQDGLINLMMIRKGVSKANLFRLFLSFSQGNHVSSPHVEMVKVLAFRLEPHSTSGNIMVDGERFEPAPIQAQILPGLARVMAIR